MFAPSWTGPRRNDGVNIGLEIGANDRSEASMTVIVTKIENAARSAGSPLGDVALK